MPVSPGGQLNLYGCPGAPREAATSVCLQSLETRQDYRRRIEEGGCCGPRCTVNWRGVNKGAGLLLLPSHTRQAAAAADWKVLPGICRVAPRPTTTTTLLHQQTANLNAGAGTQVYKQQTVGPHQRVSLKDNRWQPLPPKKSSATTHILHPP